MIIFSAVGSCRLDTGCFRRLIFGIADEDSLALGSTSVKVVGFQSGLALILSASESNCLMLILRSFFNAISSVILSACIDNSAAANIFSSAPSLDLVPKASSCSF